MVHLASILSVIAWIRQLGPPFEANHGRYLLPLAGALLVLLAGLLGSTWATRALRRNTLRRARIACLIVLGLTAVFSICVWNNFFTYHYGGYVNAYEFFHHYLGSKYSKEVGYFDLYGAVLVADAETGRGYRPADGAMTNLRTNRHEPVEPFLRGHETYRARFSTERWPEFREDVVHFRATLGQAAWNRLLHDKGYNASPPWSMVVGGLFTRHVPADSGAGLLMLALLDVALLAGALICVGRTFGIRAALLAIVLLGASYVTAHVHMKGALMRTDFVVCLILAVCAVKTGRHALAGALVGWAAMSRLFPAAFVFGIAAKLIWDLLPHRRDAWHAWLLRWGRGSSRRATLVAVVASLSAGALATAVLALVGGPEPRRIVVERLGSGTLASAIVLVASTVAIAIAGMTVWGVRTGAVDRKRPRFVASFLLSIATIFLASLVYHGGTGAWQEFARKMELHRSRPHIWNVGFETVLQAGLDREAAERASPRWPAGRVQSGIDTVVPLGGERRERRDALLLLFQTAALVSCFLLVRRLEDHRALAFGFVPTFFLIAPTYYYYITLLLPFLFFAERLERRREALGAAGLFLIGLGGFWCYHRWDQYFPTYYWISVMFLALVLDMMVVAAMEKRATEDPASGWQPPDSPRNSTQIP